MTYGDKVKKLRSIGNMTMEEFSKFCNISKPTLCRIENNNYPKKAPKKQLLKIAKIHNMPLDYFLTDDFDHLPRYAIDFIKNPESTKYIMKAYYTYMAEKSK